MIFIDLKPGHSVEGDEIKAYKTEKKAAKYIYLMAGVHGDEVEGVYMLQELFKWLQEEDDIDLPLVVVPILNVDGYRAGSRTNSHGVDLNRNYPTETWSGEFKDKKFNPGSEPLSEEENRYLIKLFDKFPPKLVISFHSWKRPMINYNGDCHEIADFLARYNSYAVCGDFDYPTPGSLGDFGPEKYKAPVLTFECPHLSEDKTLKEIWEENVLGLQRLMKSEILEF